MSTPEEIIRARLASHAGLVALVSTRSYHARLPREPVFPCVLFDWVSETHLATMGPGPSADKIGRLQVDAIADDATTARLVAEQVRLALDGYAASPIKAAVCDVGAPRNDPDTGKRYFHQDFHVFSSEPTS